MKPALVVLETSPGLKFFDGNTMKTYTFYFLLRKG